MTRTAAIVLVWALTVALAGATGCSTTPRRAAAPPPAPVQSGTTATAPTARYIMDASATPPPDAPGSDKTAHAVALVRRYVDRARLGRRAEMLGSYLPETRRSAETPVARDLELARTGGPLNRGVASFLSVAVRGPDLWPPQSAKLLTTEDAGRLRDLAAIHDDAYVVLIRSTDGASRPVFVVRDGSDWWLVP